MIYPSAFHKPAVHPGFINPPCLFVFDPDVQAVVVERLPTSPAPTTPAPETRLVGSFDWESEYLDEDDENNPLPTLDRLIEAHVTGFTCTSCDVLRWRRDKERVYLTISVVTADTESRHPIRDVLTVWLRLSGRMGSAWWDVQNEVCGIENNALAGNVQRLNGAGV